LELLARFRGIKLDVVTGSDLTAFLFGSGQLSGKKVGIIGGDEAMLPELLERFPDIELSQHIPPMGVLHKPDAAAEIEAFLATGACDYVLLAIGAPQSEIVARQCLKGGRTRGVALCIGASIEFVLGRKARAPLWMQRARLEWAFRVMSEPRRLWRRYFVLGPRIFRLVLTTSSA
jgi:exopolysaccharide biosynthesis WecB/TagA/CpsF family protein